MQPVLLFRADHENQAELEAARRLWSVEEDRMRCQNQLVVGRYSVLPFYDALEQDLAERRCRLINTHTQHRWIADFDYYPTFQDVTPESWSEEEFSSAPEGLFVLKGRCNSFKHRWTELMFANDKADAFRKAAMLHEQQLISQQGLVFRRFVPLETYEHTSSGLPITNEWRFFFVGDLLVGYGYYWNTMARIATPSMDNAGIEFAYSCASRVAGKAAFFAVDIARTVSGLWSLIELNDGQSSGLGAIDPDEFYRELKSACGQVVSAGFSSTR
ncbi:MAG: ATP-grasp domain-containing protein [Gemmataceae bacterium]